VQIRVRSPVSARTVALRTVKLRTIMQRTTTIRTVTTTICAGDGDDLESLLPDRALRSGGGMSFCGHTTGLMLSGNVCGNLAGKDQIFELSAKHAGV
jgi:hypothetical protein